MKRILVSASCLCIFLILIITGTSVAEITVFKTADVTAYNQAITGFKGVVIEKEITEVNMEGEIELGNWIIKSIKSKEPAAVLAVGDKAAELSSKEINNIPIVFCMVIDPEKHGIVGENVTGVSMEVPPKTQFSTLKSIMPRLKSIGVIYDPNKTARIIDEGEKAAQDLGLELIAREVASRGEIAKALEELIQRVGALWLVPDTTVVTRESFKYILSGTIKKEIPLLAFSDGFVKSGALLSLSPNYLSVGEEAGNIVNKILIGASTKSLPMVHPDSSLSINLDTANQLGIKIPEEIKQKANIY
ncbi:MAG: ABC transporter substrate-binding protein [Deltaproteobacteria bacterium]|nr:MAG: ABC transporter substrate-binding protein [Deltaproteobacteria bacterium]